MSRTGKAAQLEYWNGPIGKVWAKEQVKRDKDHAPLTEAVFKLAAPLPGEAVIDIGCGSGTTTLLLAEHVGRTGRAVGVDISAPMLDVARARARAQGSTAEFIEADMADYAFAPHSFDLGFSQFGVMFFPDPVAAFANIHAAMKPGARLVFVCWRGPSENPWAGVPEAAAKPLLPPVPPAAPDAPGRYSFANPDRTRSVLLQAGFHAVEIAKSDARIHLGETPEAAASSSIDAGPLLRTLADADQETRAKVRAALTARLAQEMEPGGIYLTAGAWLVRAQA